MKGSSCGHTWIYAQDLKASVGRIYLAAGQQTPDSSDLIGCYQITCLMHHRQDIATVL